MSTDVLVLVPTITVEPCNGRTLTQDMDVNYIEVPVELNHSIGIYPYTPYVV